MCRLMSTVCDKLHVDVEKVVHSPVFLVHLVRESMSFDQSIREAHMYQAYISDDDWEGCFDGLMRKGEVLTSWVEAERSCKSAFCLYTELY
jgi:hypothetical protein